MVGTHCFYDESTMTVYTCRYRPSAGLFPIVVSQDCGHEATANAINSYGSRVTHIKVHWHQVACTYLLVEY